MIFNFWLSANQAELEAAVVAKNSAPVMVLNINFAHRAVPK
jgi:hypothetical protein